MCLPRWSVDAVDLVRCWQLVDVLTRYEGGVNHLISAADLPCLSLSPCVSLSVGQSTMPTSCCSIRNSSPLSGVFPHFNQAARCLSVHTFVVQRKALNSCNSWSRYHGCRLHHGFCVRNVLQINLLQQYIWGTIVNSALAAMFSLISSVAPDTFLHGIY